MARNDPYRNYRYRVEIEGIQVAGFSEAVIPDSTTEMVEYREGNEITTVRKLSSLDKYGNITLKHGITDNMDMYNWKKDVEDTGAINKRKNISLILIDEEGNDKCRWDIREAWPIKYDASDFKATANEVLVESFEIVHEGVIRVL